MTQRFDTGYQNGSTSKATIIATFVWDTNTLGLLTSEHYSNASSTTFTYDNWARPTLTTLTVDGSPYTTQTYWDSSYDRPIGLKYPNGLQVQYQYNDAGYLEKEFDPTDDGMVYREITAQDALGNITQANLANSNMTGNYRYANATGQMQSSWVTRINGNGAANVQHITYNYDNFGNLEQQHSYFDLTNVSSEQYHYDDLQRLTQSNKTIDSTTLAIDYDYDSVGNLTLKSDYANSYTYQPSRPNAVASVTKLNNNTVNFAYDNKGNMATGDGSTLTYNVHNKPVTIAKAKQEEIPI